MPVWTISLNLFLQNNSHALPLPTVLQAAFAGAQPPLFTGVQLKVSNSTLQGMTTKIADAP